MILRDGDLETLADVRKLLKYLPEGFVAKSTWRHVAAQLLDVANGADPSEMTIPLRMVLSMEGVPCHAK